MVWMFVWVGLTLGAAAVVFLFASVVARSDARVSEQSADEQGLRAFWRDFRSGLRRGRARGRVEGHHVGTVRMPKPVDSSIEEFFAAAEVSSPAYVDAEELTDVLHHARERAVRPFHTAVDRSRDV